MNKAIALAILSLLMNAAVSVVYMVPKQYIYSLDTVFISSLFPSRGLGVSIDLHNFAKSVGKEPRSWLGKFTFQLSFVGFNFERRPYSVCADFSCGNWCPPGYSDSSCATFKSTFNTPMDLPTSFNLNNLNKTITTQARANWQIIISIQTEFGDSLLGVQSGPLLPLFIMSPPFLLQTSTFSTSCFNTTLNVSKILLQSPAYTLTVTSPVFNTNPIPGAAFDLLNANPSQIIFWDRKATNATRSYNNGTYSFRNLLNFTNHSFAGDTLHTLTMCNVLAPSEEMTPVRFGFVDHNNLTIAEFVVTLRSAYPLATKTAGIVQSTTGMLQPVELSFNLSCNAKYNWLDSYVLELSLPSAYTPGTKLQIVATSMLDKSVRTIDLVTPAQKFNVTIPSQAIFMPNGINFKLLGLNVPLTTGSHPILYQLFSSYGRRLSFLHNSYVRSTAV